MVIFKTKIETNWHDDTSKEKQLLLLAMVPDLTWTQLLDLNHFQPHVLSNLRLWLTCNVPLNSDKVAEVMLVRMFNPSLTVLLLCFWCLVVVSIVPSYGF